MRYSIDKPHNRLILMGVVGYRYQSVSKRSQYLVNNSGDGTLRYYACVSKTSEILDTM